MNWTPISEAMPPANKAVLLKQQRDGYEPFVIVGVYASNHAIESNSEDEFNGPSEFCHQCERFWLPAGFYERSMSHGEEVNHIGIVNESEIVAWMEIPGGEA